MEKMQVKHIYGIIDKNINELKELMKLESSLYIQNDKQEHKLNYKRFEYAIHRLNEISDEISNS